jgi:Trk-type K+ transport system membrane component
MKHEFRVINRVTREEQIFNSKELKRFFHCEYDPQTDKITQVKQPKETLLEVLGFSFLGIAIVILVTKIIMQWI